MSPAHMARATMEGVTTGLAYGLRRMKELGIQAEEIRLTGGGSKNRVWRQICADIFGSPVVTLENSEGAAFGAAIQSIAASGTESLSSVVDRLVRADEESRLTPQNAEIYEDLLKKTNNLAQKIYKK